MKKLFLFFFCLLAFNAFTHEVSFVYSTIDSDPSNLTKERGWALNFAALRWGNNEFSDFAFSVLFTQYGAMLRTDLDLAWIKVKALDNLELRFGKQYYDFGKNTSSGLC